MCVLSRVAQSARSPGWRRAGGARLLDPAHLDHDRVFGAGVLADEAIHAELIVRDYRLVAGAIEVEYQRAALVETEATAGALRRIDDDGHTFSRERALEIADRREAESARNT